MRVNAKLTVIFIDKHETNIKSEPSATQKHWNNISNSMCEWTQVLKSKSGWVCITVSRKISRKYLMDAVKLFNIIGLFLGSINQTVILRFIL